MGTEFDAYLEVFKKKKNSLQYMCVGVQSCIQTSKCIV